MFAFCPECGSENRPGWRFCGACGEANFEADTTATQAVSPPVGGPLPTPPPGSTPLLPPPEGVTSGSSPTLPAPGGSLATLTPSADFSEAPAPYAVPQSSSVAQLASGAGRSQDDGERSAPTLHPRTGLVGPTRPRLGRKPLSEEGCEQVRLAGKKLVKSTRGPILYAGLGAVFGGLGGFANLDLMAAFGLLLGLLAMVLGLWLRRWRRPFLGVLQSQEAFLTLGTLRKYDEKHRPGRGVEVKLTRGLLRSASIPWGSGNARASMWSPGSMIREGGLHLLLLVSGPTLTKRPDVHPALLLAVNGTMLGPSTGGPIWLLWESTALPTAQGHAPIRLGPSTSSPQLRSMVVLLLLFGLLWALVLPEPHVGLAQGIPKELIPVNSVLSGAVLVRGGTGGTEDGSVVSSTPHRGSPDDSIKNHDGASLQPLDQAGGTPMSVTDADNGQSCEIGGSSTYTPCPQSGWGTGDSIEVSMTYASLWDLGSVDWGDGGYDHNYGVGTMFTHTYSASGTYLITAWTQQQSASSLNVYIGVGGAAPAGVVGMLFGGTGIAAAWGGGGDGAGAGLVGVGATGLGSAPYYPSALEGSAVTSTGGYGYWSDPSTFVEVDSWPPPVNLPPPPVPPSGPSWIPQLPPPPLTVSELGSDSLILPSGSGSVDMSAVLDVQGGDPSQPFTYSWKADGAPLQSVTGGPSSSITHWFTSGGPHTLTVTVSQHGHMVLEKTFWQTWGGP